jgi:hypothetical protein
MKKWLVHLKTTQKTPKKIGGGNMLNRWNVMKNAGKGTEVQSYSPGFPKPL